MNSLATAKFLLSNDSQAIVGLRELFPTSYYVAPLATPKQNFTSSQIHKKNDSLLRHASQIRLNSSFGVSFFPRLTPSDSSFSSVFFLDLPLQIPVFLQFFPRITPSNSSFCIHFSTDPALTFSVFCQFFFQTYPAVFQFFVSFFS